MTLSVIASATRNLCATCMCHTAEMLGGYMPPVPTGSCTYDIQPYGNILCQNHLYMYSYYYLPHTSDGGHRPVEGNHILLKLGCTIPNYIWREDVWTTRHIVFIQVQTWLPTWLRYYRKILQLLKTYVCI